MKTKRDKTSPAKEAMINDESPPLSFSIELTSLAKVFQ